MTNHLYLRLALSNIRNNRRFYLPFLLTAALTTACFYILSAIALNPGHPGGETAALILRFGVTIVGLFALVFLFYANSFLIKRRKKELGLYNILGMEKRHIAKVLVWESLISVLIAVGGGLLAGMLLFRLMFLLLLNLTHMDVTLSASVQPGVVALTLLVFCAIFALLLLANLRQVAFSKPIELLRGGSVGEKEPKVKWPLVVIGALTLAAGYAIAILVKDIASAITLFFLAVLLVIIGTYCLFVAVSIAVLKFLKSRKRFYYKAGNFISVSGMLYRMKQNAVGLANICILSTMVLVVISSTVSLYAGMGDIIRSVYPHDISMQLFAPRENCRTEVEQLIAESEAATGVSVQKTTFCAPMTRNWQKDGADFINLNSGDVDQTFAYVCLMSAGDWESLTGQHYDLTGNEVALGEVAGSLPDQISFNGEQFTVKTRFDDFPEDAPLSGYVYNDLYYVIVADDATLVHLYHIYNEEDKTDIRTTMPLDVLYLDIGGTEEENKAFSDDFTARILAENTGTDDAPFDSISYRTKAADIEDVYGLYGGFLFIGIFLGGLFLMATVLIIYYKQIIEGYDDRARFEIMQKVGMDKKLISSSIRSQVLTMFLLPLAVAAMHLCFAFPLLSRVLAAMQLTNVHLFLGCTGATFAAFVVVYLLVYVVTSRVYYKTVSAPTN